MPASIINDHGAELEDGKLCLQCCMTISEPFIIHEKVTKSQKMNERGWRFFDCIELIAEQRSIKPSPVGNERWDD
jgi:hypothetical protein